MKPNILEAKKRIKECIKAGNNRLDISRLDLTKIPKEIEQCTHITWLICSYNELDKLPKCLVNLEMLECGYNNLHSLPSTYHKLNTLLTKKNDIHYIPHSYNITGMYNWPLYKKYMFYNISSGIYHHDYHLRKLYFKMVNDIDYIEFVSIMKTILYIQRMYRKYLFLFSFYSVY